MSFRRCRLALLAVFVAIVFSPPLLIPLGAQQMGYPTGATFNITATAPVCIATNIGERISLKIEGVTNRANFIVLPPTMRSPTNYVEVVNGGATTNTVWGTETWTNLLVGTQFSGDKAMYRVGKTGDVNTPIEERWEPPQRPPNGAVWAVGADGSNACVKVLQWISTRPSGSN